MSIPAKGALRSFIARKGPFFLVNHLILAPLAFWLVFKIAQAGLVYERSYQIVRLLILGCIAIFGYLSLLLGRRGNARLLLCFAGAYLAGEILLRTLGSFGIGARNDSLWREPRPYFMFGGPSDGRAVTLLPQMGGGVVHLNAEGFRIEREIVIPKPTDELRIFVLGGSTVVGGPYAATLPTIIETHLQAGGYRRPGSIISAC